MVYFLDLLRSPINFQALRPNSDRPYRPGMAYTYTNGQSHLAPLAKIENNKIFQNVIRCANVCWRFFPCQTQPDQSTQVNLGHYITCTAVIWKDEASSVEDKYWTVEPCYNEVIGPHENVTLCISGFLKIIIQGKKKKKKKKKKIYIYIYIYIYKELEPAKWPCYKRVSLYPTSFVTRSILYSRFISVIPKWYLPVHI